MLSKKGHGLLEVDFYPWILNQNCRWWHLLYVIIVLCQCKITLLRLTMLICFYQAQPKPSPSSKEKFIFQHFFSECWPSRLTGVYIDSNWKVTSISLVNGRQHCFVFFRWKTTLILLNRKLLQFVFVKRRPYFFYWRGPKMFGKEWWP